MRDGIFTAMVAVMPEQITMTVAKMQAQNPRRIAAVLGDGLDSGCSLLDMLNLPNAHITGQHNEVAVDHSTSPLVSQFVKDAGDADAMQESMSCVPDDIACQAVEIPSRVR